MWRHARVSQLVNKDSHEYWENALKQGGTTLRSKTSEFLGVLRAALRDVSFWMIAENAAYVYREGDSHILGQVTVARNAGDYDYTVTADKILNGRYSSAPERNSMVSKDIVRALRNAKTYLVPPPVISCMQFDLEIIKKLRTSELNALARKSSDALFRLTGKNYSNIDSSNRLIGQLIAARDKLDFILDAAFLADLDAYTLAEREYTRATGEASAANARSLYARIERNGDRVVYNFIPIPKNLEPANPALSLVYGDDNLPDALREKLAVVSMLAPKQYVAGVGVRLDDKVFIIITD